MFRFETLEIWKDSVVFVKEIYSLTEKFPKKEIFGIVSQLRRAAVSIVANIAEGSASTTVRDFRNYLDISRKSVFEVVSLLLVAEELNYINEETRLKFYNKAEILAKRIVSFKNCLKNS